MTGRKERAKDRKTEREEKRRQRDPQDRDRHTGNHRDRLGESSLEIPQGGDKSLWPWLPRGTE